MHMVSPLHQRRHQKSPIAGMVTGLKSCAARYDGVARKDVSAIQERVMTADSIQRRVHKDSTHLG